MLPKSLRPTLAASLMGAVAMLATMPAAAQFQKPEDAIKYRQGAMNVMGNHFARIGAMANGRVPFDANAAQANAEIVVTMSKLPFAGFIAGTDKGETKAKPEIWTEPDKFRAAAQKMQEELVRLSAAAKTGNVDQLKTAFGAAGASCKACHDDYRSK